MPLITKNIEHAKFNTIIWLQIKKLPFSRFIPWISMGNNNIKTAFLQGCSSFSRYMSEPWMAS